MIRALSLYDLDLERLVTAEEIMERERAEEARITELYALHLAELQALAVARGNEQTTTNQRDAV